MRVEQILTPEGATRYVLLDDRSQIVEPVLRYLKFLDTGVTARNSLRTYCYHLRLFFTFLQRRELTYSDVGIDDMAAFIRWLQHPTQWRLEQVNQKGQDEPDARDAPNVQQEEHQSSWTPKRLRSERPMRQPRTVN